MYDHTTGGISSNICILGTKYQRQRHPSMNTLDPDPVPIPESCTKKRAGANPLPRLVNVYHHFLFALGRI